jgi:hypothetical protein
MVFIHPSIPFLWVLYGVFTPLFCCCHSFIPFHSFKFPSSQEECLRSGRCQPFEFGTRGNEEPCKLNIEEPLLNIRVEDEAIAAQDFRHEQALRKEGLCRSQRWGREGALSHITPSDLTAVD